MSSIYPLRTAVTNTCIPAMLFHLLGISFVVLVVHTRQQKMLTLNAFKLMQKFPVCFLAIFRAPHFQTFGTTNHTRNVALGETNPSLIESARSGEYVAY